MEEAARRSSAADITLPQARFTTEEAIQPGKFNNEPTEEGALQDRIEKLERLVGRLTLENEFLKRGLQHSLSQSQRNGKSSGYGDCSALPSVGGAD